MLVVCTNKVNTVVVCDKPNRWLRCVANKIAVVVCSKNKIGVVVVCSKQIDVTVICGKYCCRAANKIDAVVVYANK